jgi:hypothetical protein
MKLSVNWSVVAAVAIGYLIVTMTAPLWQKITAPISAALASAVNGSGA